MTKQETLTFYYENCGECPNVLDYFDTGKVGYRCDRGKRIRIIHDLGGKIPDWCPLPDKIEPLIEVDSD